MKNVTLPSQKFTPNFIGSWIISPLTVCDELITYFEFNKGKQTSGVTGAGIKLDNKNSTDIVVHPKDVDLPGNEVFKEYFNCLFSCYRKYVNDWPFIELFPDNLQIGSFNLQRYTTGQHYQGIHTERSSLQSLHRVFAWMTYLNDVDIENGGSTQFTHYGLEIQPKKGLTLIWPAEWTHAHKGNLLKSDSKYIITGWLHFPTY